MDGKADDSEGRAGHSSPTGVSGIRHTGSGELSKGRKQSYATGDEVLAGRYQIRRRLGEGGMGVVYEAFDSERESAVALKTLTRVDARGIYRLKSEFRSLADVAHPNLVRLHELHADNGRWFFTMGLVEGRPFVDHVREDPAIGFDDTVTKGQGGDAEATVRTPVIARARGEGMFRERTLRECLAELARGVQAIHDAGKLHRDLKPSNVLVSDTGRVVILDFGLVSEKVRASLDGVGRTLAEEAGAGTPGYMSPEQSRGEPATAASDWYAVGVMLFQALTGQLPFEGTVYQVITAKQNREAPAPSSLVTGIPDDLDRLCVELLRRDPKERSTGDRIFECLGVTPHSVVELLSGTHHHKPAKSDEAAAPFVGRESELRELAECLRLTDEGNPVVALITGPSGIGKTALLEHFIEPLRKTPDTVILSGRCYEREAVPYKAFDGVIDAVTRALRRLPDAQAARLLPRNVHALCRLFPVLERVDIIANARRRTALPSDPQELRRVAFASLKELFARIVDGSRLIITIDDLQWGDADSFEVLDGLLGTPDPPGLLLIGTCRNDEAERGPMLRELLDPQRGLPGIEVRKIAVEPMTRSEVATLVEQLAPGRTPRIGAETIHAESQGNPFFVTEIVRYAGSTDASHPVGLAEALHARMTPMAEPARHLLEAIAVAGRPLDPTTAAAVCVLPVASINESFDMLRVAGLARRVGSGSTDGGHGLQIATSHDRVRDAVTAALSDEERRGWHRRLAEVLEKSGQADPESLSYHFMQAEDFRRAGRYALDAARRAGDSLAFERAAMLYRVALDHGDIDDKERLGLLVQLGDTLFLAGRDADSANAYLEASHIAVGPEDAPIVQDCRRRAAEQLVLSGEVERGMEVLSAVLAEVGVRLPRSQQRAAASLVWDMLVLKLRGLRFIPRKECEVPAQELALLDAYNVVGSTISLVRPLYAAQLLVRHVLCALRAGEPRHAHVALAQYAALLSTAGVRAYPQAVRFIEASIPPLEQLAPEMRPRFRALLTGVEGITALFSGNFIEGREKIALCVKSFDDGPVIHAGEYMHRKNFYVLDLLSLWLLGRYSELMSRVDVVVRDAVRRGDRHLEATATRWFNRIRLLRDEPDAASKALDAVTWNANQGEFDVQQSFELMGRAEIDLYTNAGLDLPARYEALNRAYDRSLTRRLELSTLVQYWLRGRLWLHNAEHGIEPRRALRNAHRWARTLSRALPRYAHALGSLVAAGVEWQRGNLKASEQSLREAIRHAEACSVTLELATARFRLAQIVGGDEGSTLREEALAWAGREGVVNPEKFFRVFAPGFDRRGAVALLGSGA